MNRPIAGLLAILAFTLVTACSTLPWVHDPHVTAAGFFDMHVCNWPERPLFFKLVFSSARFDLLQDVQVFTPDHELLARFDLDQYKTVNRPGKPLKRVYLVDIPVPPNARNGWYTARIRTRDGQTLIARDRIEIRQMEQAVVGVLPEDESVHAVPPRELSWAPVAGARYYMVFIHDRWDSDRLIYESPRLAEPRLILPPGIVQPGGAYRWRVNTRDRHEDREFGDFNHGSLSQLHSFSIQDPS